MSKDILYPLRRLHGKLHDRLQEHKRRSRLKKTVESWDSHTVLMPGVPEHINLGDSAIALAQAAFLERCGLKAQFVSFFGYYKDRELIRKALPENVLIAQLGGGNMGSQWKDEEAFHRQIVLDFPNNPMVIFPQTVYYAPEAEEEARASQKVYNTDALVIVAREQHSYETVARMYPAAKHLLVPDIVLSASMETFGAAPQNREGVLLCMRSDAERAMSDDERALVEQAVAQQGISYSAMDMYAGEKVNEHNRAMLVKAKMEQIASARLVITDRLHGMVFAAVTGTPCIVFSNYNHKVRGTYEWIKYLPYIRFAETAQEAAALVPELLAMGPQTYDNAPLQPYYDELARVVKENADD